MLPSFRIPALVLLATGLAAAEGEWFPPDAVPLLAGYECSWIGNSGGRGPRGAGDWVQNQVFALHVASDGTLYANSPWDEGGREIGIYRDGRVVGGCEETHPVLAGYAITGDDTYVYAGMKSGFVRRYHPDGRRARFPGGERGGADLAVGGASKGPQGMALFAGRLYCSVPGADGADDELVVVDPATMTIERRLPFPGARELAADPAGRLWVLVEGDAPRVVCVDAAGRPLGPVIDDIERPSALAVDRAGRVLVADHGRAQQVVVYDATGSPRRVGTLGVEGGIFAGERGVMGPERLYGITALACGADGTVYVNCNGWRWDGTDLRAFTSDGELRWRLQAMFFVDTTCADPRDAGRVYGPTERLEVDHDAPPGSGWRFAASTLDPFTYPDDPRLHQDISCPRIVWIDDQRFLAGSDMDGKGLKIWRFDREIAVPAVAFLSTWDRKQAGWPPARPQGVVNLLWRDADGDGQYDPDEYADLATEGIPNKRCGIDGVLDANGDYWRPLWNETIVHYPCRGVDQRGVPRYDPEPASIVARPDDFTDMERIEYDPATDTMFITGYTAAWPQRDSFYIPAGTAVAAYPGWKAGNREAAWITRLPYSKQPFCLPKSIAIAGDMLFVGFAGAEMVVAIDQRDGRILGRMVPTEAIAGTHGDNDVPWAISAHRRDDGTYLVFVEDDRYAKNVIYRWRP